MYLLVVGGGKMGLSHVALSTPYIGKGNVAVCDNKLSTRMLFRALGYSTFGSPEKAIRKLGKPAAVLIATPTSSHYALVSWAINSGIPFFVEKPLTLDVEKSGQLVRAADERAVAGQVGFVMRYGTTFQRLKELLQDMKFGRALSYSASMRGSVITKPLPEGAWQGDSARGGGCLNEYGPHLIDLCRFLFGEIVSIHLVETEKVFCVRADDRVRVTWTHRDGTSGEILVDWCDPTRRKSSIEFNIEFEKCNVRADNSAIDFNLKSVSEILPEVRQEIMSPILPNCVGYYLRGEEFSLELEDFFRNVMGLDIGSQSEVLPHTTPTLVDGYETDFVISQIRSRDQRV